MNTATRQLSARLLLGATLLASALSGAAFAAQPSDGAPRVHVRYSDLDLRTEQGSSALYQRITSAAREVCGSVDIRDLTGLTANRKCQSEAVARAVSDLNSPQLAMVHAARTRHG
jgi:UrcA family protein